MPWFPVQLLHATIPHETTSLRVVYVAVYYDVLVLKT